jgi:acylphosphatase
MPESNVKMIVSGLVQGVGFRYFVYRRAVDMGLAGYAKNLPSGQVEIVASGNRGLIDELIKAVRVGPKFSSVSNIELEEIQLDTTYSRFEIR